MQQQVQLTRKEIVNEIREGVVGWAVISAGVVTVILGFIMACLTASHFLHWGLSPPESDPASLPLWACYGIVSATLLAIGGGIARIGCGTVCDTSSGSIVSDVFRGPSQ